MTNHDDSHTSEERPGRKRADAGMENKRQATVSESGTEGPAGPVDDQPQREDEYLSSMLKEFNPQRKDTTTPLPAAQRGKVQQPDGPADTTTNRKEKP